MYAISNLFFLHLFTIVSCKTLSTLSSLDYSCPELTKLCNDHKKQDEFSILNCLYSLDPNLQAQLDDNCHTALWKYSSDIIENDKVKEGLADPCPDLQLLSCDNSNANPGSFLKCVVSKKDDIADAKCLDRIELYENAAFYDVNWIGSFLLHCKDDVVTLKCGRIDFKSASQANTITCLQDKIARVKDECRKEVFHLAEIQADNIKLDHQLYIDCAEDYNKYCSQFFPGSGKIFKCLVEHRHEKLSVKCFNRLQRRQRLISQDYKISKGLMRACREDIKKAHCRKQTSDDREIRLAQILICLQNVMHNGTKIDPDCEKEMDEHRKMLMEDFRLSPEIVNGCAREIHDYCEGLEIGGKTIHCLMDHARLKHKNKRITAVCQRALEDLVKETVVGEDWRVDPVLHEACNPVVRAMCHDIRGGNARVLSCLMDNIGADHMTEDCEDALMQIQYFVARNFKLDPQLYKACHEDATRLCHANQDWESNDIDQSPDNSPLILPCLYRYVYSPEQKMKLKTSCTEQIRRVMRQRAISVDLQPEVEEVCLSDLSLYCFDKTAKGEEMQCLQKNLLDLQDKCKSAIINYTEVEAQNVGLNPFITKYCKKAMETHCSPEVKHDDGEMMECLIAHKNDPDVKANMKCRVNIEHFQIISLKDYRFSYKFKIACKYYAARYCANARTKADVVTCLSEKVRNDTINGLKSDVHKECRQQIKAQLFQQRENINFNPKLKEACSKDIKEYCGEIEQGSSQVLECLQLRSSKLSELCQREIFKVKKQELTDNSIDYALIKTCEGSIQQFCSSYEKEQILECLKKHKEEAGFNKACRLIVIHRMIEQNSDYRLNPILQENCKADINKFCHETIMKSKPDQELNGEVIKCLKMAFKRSKLSNKCEKEMATILREQALDVQLNPLLKAVCKSELETICKTNDDNDAGSAEECLKNALLNHKIPSAACQVEVANMIEESQADIHVDPLLQQTCSVDLLKYCKEIPQGQGRHIKCLKSILSDNPSQLESDCKNMLSKRLEMFKNAAEIVPVANLKGLYIQVVTSPARQYFFLVGLMAIGSFFVIGMFCGRVTKRQLQSKNK